MLKSTQDIRNKMAALYEQLENGTVSNQTARVRINAARTIIETLKVEIASEALGQNARVISWGDDEIAADPKVRRIS